MEHTWQHLYISSRWSRSVTVSCTQSDRQTSGQTDRQTASQTDRDGQITMSVGVSERLVRLARQFNCFYLRTEAALLAIPVAVIRGPQAITNTNNTNSNSNGTGQYCRPFIVEGHQVGLIRQDILDHLTSFPEVLLCIALNSILSDIFTPFVNY